MPSKLVTQRQRTARVVETAVKAHGAEAARHLEEKLRLPSLAEDGTPATALELLEGLAGHLGSARQRLVSADEAHLAELRNDRAPRRRRDALVEALYRKVVDLRAAVEAIFGPGSSQELVGLEGETSRDSEVLHRQGQRMLELFSDPALTWPEARYNGIELSPAECAEVLRPEVEALGVALADVAEDRHRAETTLAEKNEAMEAFDRIYQGVARMVEGAFSLAELDVQAERVRPTRRRSSQPVEEDPAPEPFEEAPAPPAFPVAAAPVAGLTGVSLSEPGIPTAGSSEPPLPPLPIPS